MRLRIHANVMKQLMVIPEEDLAEVEGIMG